MKLLRIFAFATTLSFLSACLPEAFTPYYPTISQSPRFNITNYTEVATADTDLAGHWMMIQSGTRNENISGVNYRTTGYQREIIEIYEDNGTFYAKACVQAEAAQQLVTISGDNVTVTLNGNDLTLTKTDFKNMSGSAKQESGASYTFTGSVEMKKVAASDSSFGSFSFQNNSEILNTVTADCFHESDIGLTGVVGVISKYALLEAFNAVDWSPDGSTYSQTAYAFQKGGDIDPIKTITFVDGANVTGPTASRQYPLEGQTFDRTANTLDANNFDTSLNITGTGGFSGSTNIDVVSP